MKLLREIVENKTPLSTILVDVALCDDNMLMLNEFAQPQQTKSADMRNLHLDHIEDLIIRDGKEGWQVVQDVLKNTYKHIRSGKSDRGFGISTKVDGSPALVVGRDPKDGRFFVGTKSFFNRTPKINFTPDDIKLNHGNSPGLAKRLQAALEHLPKVTPKIGIYQGDMMFSHDDKIDNDDGKISFQPNTLTYSHPLYDKKNVDKDGKPKFDKEGERIKNAKFGFAPHTEYKDVGDGEMVAKFTNPVSKFNRKHPDVYIMDPRLDQKKVEFSPEKAGQFKEFMKRAGDAHKVLLKANGYHIIKDHESLLLGYINNCVAERRNPNPAGYTAWVENKYKDKAKSLKMGSSKSRVKAELDYALNDLMQSRGSLVALFTMHSLISKAKNILVDALSSGSKFEHSYQGRKSKPEGFVVTHNKRATKLVDRHHFSAANFEWNKKVNPGEGDTVVLSWGRMNPPTAGHEKIVNKGAEVAKKLGAKHQVVATRTQNKDTDPLGPEDKLKHLKTLFPGKNVVLAGPDAPTIMGQLSALCHAGVKRIVMVTGGEKVGEYQRLLTKYNTAGGPFHFESIRVISAGSRNAKSDGPEGTSGTKQRDAVRKNDFKGFQKGLPSSASGRHAKRMFGDLKKAMGIIQMDKVKRKEPKVPTLGQSMQQAIKEKA